MVGFIVLLNVFTEYNTSSAEDVSVTLFKRGSKPPAIAASSGDDEDAAEKGEEKIKPIDRAPSHLQDARAADEAIRAQPPMTDVFSWQHLDYVVPVGHGETRKLLDDVSGYVAPGKLTALMGESGAGKVSIVIRYYACSARKRGC